jgi:sugar phosphate isomerase/epimerase
MSVFDWIKLAAPLRCDGLELWSGMFPRPSLTLADRVAQALADAGQVMPMLCVSTDFTNPDAGQRQAEFDREVELIEFAHRISGPGVAVRVLSGQRHPGVSREQGLDWAASSIKALFPLARQLDVLLSLENHYKDGAWAYPEFAQKTDVFLDLLKLIGDEPNFGVQYDPSNAIVAGVDSADFLDLVVDRVITMQASDRFLEPGASLDDLRLQDGTLGYSPKLSHGVIGRGLNDYQRIFQTLAGHGYDGWISIEDGVNGMADLTESVKFLRQARETYFDGSTAVRVEPLEQRRQAAGLPSLALPSLALPGCGSAGSATSGPGEPRQGEPC